MGHRNLQLRCLVYLAICISLTCSARLCAIEVVYPEFSNPSGLDLNGDAAAMVTGDGSVIRLVSAVPSQSGSFFSQSQLMVEGFNTQFSFRLTNPGGVWDGTEVGADGFVFVIQPISSSIGAGGGGLGYSGISPSVGVEFDTFLNPENSDVSTNHVGVDVNGSVISDVDLDVANRFDNGNKWFGWIDYDGTTLEVRANETGIRPVTALLSFAVDIPTIIGTSGGFIGFTAGTGDAYANHDILSWRYQDRPIPEPAGLILALTALAAGSSLARGRSGRVRQG